MEWPDLSTVKDAASTASALAKLARQLRDLLKRRPLNQDLRALAEQVQVLSEFLMKVTENATKTAQETTRFIENTGRFIEDLTRVLAKGITNHTRRIEALERQVRRGEAPKPTKKRKKQNRKR